MFSVLAHLLLTEEQQATSVLLLIAYIVAKMVYVQILQLEVTENAWFESWKTSEFCVLQSWKVLENSAEVSVQTRLYGGDDVTGMA